MSTREYKLTKILDTSVDATPGTIALAQAYGIGMDDAIKMPLYTDLSVILGPKRVVYITGESGGGKSTLLRHLVSASAKDFTALAHDLGEDDRPLIDLFPGVPLMRAAQYLAWAGISEPFVMLRRPNQLSDGQRYRLRLSLAMFHATKLERPLVALDEFCAVLDRETAKAVAHNVRKTADATGICFVLASTHDDIIEHLDPDAIYRLRLNVDPEVKQRTQSLKIGA